jgi:hypothetical protein
MFVLACFGGWEHVFDDVWCVCVGCGWRFLSALFSVLWWVLLCLVEVRALWQGNDMQWNHTYDTMISEIRFGYLWIIKKNLQRLDALRTPCQQDRDLGFRFVWLEFERWLLETDAGAHKSTISKAAHSSYLLILHLCACLCGWLCCFGPTFSQSVSFPFQVFGPEEGIAHPQATAWYRCEILSVGLGNVSTSSCFFDVCHSPRVHSSSWSVEEAWLMWEYSYTQTQQA